MVKLRLTRLGRKRVPFYRIAAMEALSRRDGKAVAYLGTYNPLAEDCIEGRRNFKIPFKWSSANRNCKKYLN